MSDDVVEALLDMVISLVDERRDEESLVEGEDVMETVLEKESSSLEEAERLLVGVGERVNDALRVKLLPDETENVTEPSRVVLVVGDAVGVFTSTSEVEGVRVSESLCVTSAVAEFREDDGLTERDIDEENDADCDKVFDSVNGSLAVRDALLSSVKVND